MSASESRLQKLYKELTAKERAIMRLRWFKEDAEEPPELFQTTPWEQIDEINRLARIGGATHRYVSPFALWLQARLQATSVRFGIISAFQLWSLHADRLLGKVLFEAGEPITQSAYDARLAAARSEALPVDVLAELLAEADLEEEDLDDRQYKRRLAEHERKLRQLVADGTLPGTGRGRSVKVPAGAFYDWRGEETPVLPERGLRYEVFPDGAAQQVQQLRAQREEILKLLEEAPQIFPLPGVKGERDSKVDVLGRQLVRTVAGEVTAAWAELLALERVVKDASDRFDGEEAIHPEVRRVLDEIGSTATELQERLQPWIEGFVLPGEPDEQLLRALASIIEHDTARP